ncbi:type VII secretion protein EssB [Geobacillus icigianus]|uniref:ESX secretion system protein YukC n=1 Tax=Geobacillus subterraneus TaxID=129338 RepID=A0A679FR56_9BACL|nr:MULTISPECIES: type VII secretion protein EssB [Geobacillus]KYD27805.1 hypothetical protein B4113_0039 [Geobacillus sp. B4113_201601]BBW97539.1 ESX secretion system protein YukC [Geobacillus subterraneus]
MNEKRTYLEIQVDAVMTGDQPYVLVFQRAKLKMQHPLELEIVKEADPCIKRDIDVSEDEVRMVIQPPSSFLPFAAVKKMSLLSRIRAALQLVSKVKHHSARRLILIVCPENLVFNRALEPFFLHVGVKESLPPDEWDDERLLREVKATVLALTEGEYRFDEYLKFHETLKCSPMAKELWQADHFDALLAFLEKWADEEEEKERSQVHISKKRWNAQRYIFFSAIGLLIPAIIYVLYSFFLAQPKQEAYIQGTEWFLQNKYSDVITALEDYAPEDMPYVIQYELAFSYVMTESLTEKQRETVLNNITLKTDEPYMLYWIYIGRGQNEEALELARTMEDRDLIVYALLKYREQMKGDTELSGAEKQRKLEDIDQEIEEYERERKETETSLEEERTRGEQLPASTPATNLSGETTPSSHESPAINHQESKK